MWCTGEAGSEPSPAGASSRDTILHIADKEDLFRKFLSTLKPGGKLMISDYCCGDQEHSQQFKDYVAQRNYKLHTVRGYGAVIQKAGFKNVRHSVHY
jgi:phosphoethanolamine N-methyltransferase